MTIGSTTSSRMNPTRTRVPFPDRPVTYACRLDEFPLLPDLDLHLPPASGNKRAIARNLMFAAVVPTLGGHICIWYVLPIDIIAAALMREV